MKSFRFRMKKAKRKTRIAPFRYHLAWRTRGDFNWREKLYVAIPKGIVGICEYQPTRLEDLLTGEVPHCSFNLRQQVWFATHPEHFPLLRRRRAQPKAKFSSSL